MSSTLQNGMKLGILSQAAKAYNALLISLEALGQCDLTDLELLHDLLQDHHDKLKDHKPIQITVGGYKGLVYNRIRTIKAQQRREKIDRNMQKIREYQDRKK